MCYSSRDAEWNKQEKNKSWVVIWRIGTPYSENIQGFHISFWTFHINKVISKQSKVYRDKCLRNIKFELQTRTVKFSLRHWYLLSGWHKESWHLHDLALPRKAPHPSVVWDSSNPMPSIFLQFWLF
jgi:hypothetical protein